jgi:hypothetical protein
VPVELTVMGWAVLVSQLASVTAVARHSTAKTESPGVKSTPEMLTASPFVKFVDGVNERPGPVAKENEVNVTSTPDVVAIEITQVALVADVPQLPFPIVPVATSNDDVSDPVALTVIGSSDVELQPADEVAPDAHSTATRDSLGVKPVPEMATD